MSREPTLLEDLAECAEELNARERDNRLNPAVVLRLRARAARLRAAAARLREEMARAKSKWRDTTSTACRNALERVNGGPFEP